MANQCLLPDEFGRQAQKLMLAFIKNGRVGFDSMVSYFHETGKIDKLTSLLPYFKDAYKGLQNANLGLQEKLSLWSEKAVDEFDIPNFLKSLENAKQRREEIEANNERRAQGLFIGTQRVPIFDGTDIAEGPNAKPALRYAKAALLPEIPRSIESRQYPLFANPGGEHQVYGVNAILNAFKEGKPGFFLADKQGTGKTLQILVAANEIALMPGTDPVLIVVPNEQVKARFFEDARKMNRTNPFNSLVLDTSRVQITTYGKLSKFTNLKFSAVFYDESQNIANRNNANKAAKEMIAPYTVFSSGTPFESPIQSLIFLSKIMGMTEEQVSDMLGFSVVEQEVNGRKVEKVAAHKNITEIQFLAEYVDKINKIVDDLAKGGQYLKRQYPFWGKVYTDNITNTVATNDVLSISNVMAYWTKRISNYLKMAEKKGIENTPQYRRQLEAYGADRLRNITIATEIAKANYIYSRLKNDVASGKNVVILTNFVGDEKLGFTLNVEGIDGVGATKVKTEEGQNVKNISGQKTLFGILFDRMTNDKIPFSMIYSGITDRDAQISNFQNNLNNVMIATMESGGTGIDLDDQTGDRPRVMYIPTKGYSEKELQQAIFRISRRNTKSYSEVVFVNMDSFSDNRMNVILDNKKNTLFAAMAEGSNVESAETDLATSLREFYLANKDMLAGKKINSVEDLFKGYQDFKARTVENNSLNDYFNELTKC